MDKNKKKLNEGFLDDMVFMVLMDTHGVKADRWLDMIDKVGDRQTLRQILIHERLDGRKIIDRKPYGIFDDTYQLGDYVLWWDEDERFVKVIEMADKNNKYDKLR